MKLDEARRVAEAVVARLRPQCERIAVAGSVRREEPEVHDVEIVYVATMAATPGQLLDVHSYPLTEDVIKAMVDEGLLRYDTDVRRNGPKYKRMIHCPSGAVVELFRAESENWGLILALRTGPAKFNKMLVAHGWEGGVLPPDHKVRDGYLWRRGVIFPTPEEESFFRAIEVPCWPPQMRHPGRLAMHERSRSKVRRFE